MVIEKKMELRQTRGRQRQTMLDWMMEDSLDRGGYGKLKEEAQ